MKHDSISPDEKAAALLRVASYLGRPQQFMAIADARAEMRRTLELAAKGSVVLTTHGEPAAAVVPFTTLEDICGARCYICSSRKLRRLSRVLKSALSLEAEKFHCPAKRRWKDSLEKHCAERDDRAVGLAVRCHAGEHAARASKSKRGRVAGRCRRVDSFNDVPRASKAQD
jgi:antitoxin (DNA-binding transcriptional repressor) of toxin-antitoxin stability system